MNVLIIDDNQDITTMLSKYLRRCGHMCMVANDGRNGLVRILNQKFDAIILDLAIPEFSGMDIIDVLERKNQLKDQKIIVLTAISQNQDELDSLVKKGVHSCLRKPIDPDELIEYLLGVI